MDNGYRILLAVMGLDIGGAETHVLELARGLKRRGFNVMVASNGGAYEKELAEAQIPHFKVPLQSRGIRKMITAYYGLKKIIKQEKIDIVHAHARIPAFICGLLHKRMKFAFITTVHGVYSTVFPLRVLTDWGQKTIAVSKDIKDYILKNYPVPEQDITVTINGIDTEKFSAHTPTDDVREELGLSKDKRRIVYVSRMDKDAGLLAFQLTDIALRLLADIPELEILIVGNGDAFNDLKKRVDEVNERAGFPLIRLTGARTDVNKLIATGEVFVGVSRAALEAMSAERPLVVAGNAGYMGIFSSDNLALAIDLNFTCRGCPLSDAEKLYRDLHTLMCKITPEQRALVGAFGRKVILDHYSLERMTDDNIEAYKSLLTEKKLLNDVVISGYYGFKNNGDDALLQAIISDLKHEIPEVKICVLSLRPRETRRVYGVASVYRFNPFSVSRELKGAKLLINGGGSLIQDVTSTQSLLYYLFIIRMAIKRGIRTMLYANGIGPVTHYRNRRMVRQILNKMDLITLRERSSQDELKRLGVFNPYIRLTADPAFTIVPSPRGEVQELLTEIGVRKDEKLVAISLRNWRDNAPGFEQNVALTADYLYEQLGLVPLFLSMQFPVDLKAVRRAAAKMKHKSYVVEKNLTGAQMLGLVGECGLTIGMRLHTLIYSVAVGVPTIGIVYDPKIVGFMEYVGERRYIYAKELTFEGIKVLIDDFIGDKDKGVRECKLDEMRRLSRINASLAADLMNGSFMEEDDSIDHTDTGH